MLSPRHFSPRGTGSVNTHQVSVQETVTIQVSVQETVTLQVSVQETVILQVSVQETVTVTRTVSGCHCV